ncbi:MAG: UDP-N-acetylglucosamine--N-acetylmuramyl-(pentapeptide) pyrophosphoryl-undecaprenol N-acetylglucosamine transferase [Phycisphaerales bacterium]|nr:MAG: UDP-N-acetylglucosamine--N-acetylmuramyl-(pentapeptide) pyrophosphoryl-undecaprenol N-acetylglucosamine transferase [Phycisphaerales bacterium]
MNERRFLFAGGGTGGHIYPAIAVAEQIKSLDAGARIEFFCSRRQIDSRILSNAGHKFTALTARGFSLRPRALIEFVKGFRESSRIASHAISTGEKPVVVGVGGFVAAPVCWAAHRLKVPLMLLNVDIVPGRANRLIGRWADEIFVQFEDTRASFAKAGAKIHVLGCPLRSGFENPQPQKVVEQLALDTSKKILLITGASSGSANINDAVCSLLGKLEGFAQSWQIVHLTGTANFDSVKTRYRDAKIAHRVLAYHDEMADLLAAADLVIGRSGAVSVAEYAAAGVPSICMPYPYHKDRHQYLNAGKLVEVGAGIIVDDVPDAVDRSEWLWEELKELIKDDAARARMKANCKLVARRDASVTIARRLLASKV